MLNESQVNVLVEKTYVLLEDIGIEVENDEIISRYRRSAARSSTCARRTRLPMPAMGDSGTTRRPLTPGTTRRSRSWSRRSKDSARSGP